MYGVTGSPFSGPSIRKVWFMITILISFKVASTKAFLTSAGNLVTSEKVLGSGMECDTSEPDSPKIGNYSLIHLQQP